MTIFEQSFEYIRGYLSRAGKAHSWLDALIDYGDFWIEDVSDVAILL